MKRALILSNARLAIIASIVMVLSAVPHAQAGEGHDPHRSEPQRDSLNRPIQPASGTFHARLLMACVVPGRTGALRQRTSSPRGPAKARQP